MEFVLMLMDEEGSCPEKRFNSIDEAVRYCTTERFIQCLNNNVFKHPELSLYITYTVGMMEKTYVEFIPAKGEEPYRCRIHRNAGDDLEIEVNNLEIALRIVVALWPDTPVVQYHHYQEDELPY